MKSNKIIKNIVASVIIILGVLFLVGNYFNLGIEYWKLWPVFVILAGVSIMNKN